MHTSKVGNDRECIMDENGKFEKPLSKLFTVLFVLVFLWGQVGGIYHAFTHYSTRDGLLAVFLPPYSWYRSIEFFFWMGRNGLTKSEKDEVGYFVRSILRSEEANDIMYKRLSGKPSAYISSKDLDEIIKLMEESLKESQGVSDSTLLKLHPDLANVYRKKLCEGTRIALQGYENWNSLISYRGELLLQEWDAWYNANSAQLKDEIYKKNKVKVYKPK